MNACSLNRNFGIELFLIISLFLILTIYNLKAKRGYFPVNLEKFGQNNPSPDLSSALSGTDCTDIDKFQSGVIPRCDDNADEDCCKTATPQKNDPQPISCPANHFPYYSDGTNTLCINKGNFKTKIGDVIGYKVTIKPSSTDSKGSLKQKNKTVTIDPAIKLGDYIGSNPNKNDALGDQAGAIYGYENKNSWPNGGKGSWWPFWIQDSSGPPAGGAERPSKGGQYWVLAKHQYDSVSWIRDDKRGYSGSGLKYLPLENGFNIKNLSNSNEKWKSCDYRFPNQYACYIQNGKKCSSDYTEAYYIKDNKTNKKYTFKKNKDKSINSGKNQMYDAVDNEIQLCINKLEPYPYVNLKKNNNANKYYTSSPYTLNIVYNKDPSKVKSRKWVSAGYVDYYYYY